MRTRAALLALCLSAIPLAGCGEDDSPSAGSPAAAASPSVTTNGVDKQEVPAALKSAQEAFLAAETVRVKGDVTSDGMSMKIDLHMGEKGTSRGTLVMDGQTIKVMTNGKHAYLAGDEKFWTSVGGADAAKLLKGKHLKTTIKNKDFKDLLALTDRAELAKGMLPSEGLAFDGQETISGVRTVRYKDFSGGVYNVALDGEPYPVRASGKDKGESLKLDFLDYGKPVDVKPPPAGKTIDADKLGG